MVDLQAAAWAECTKFRLGCTSPLHLIVSGERAKSTSRASRLRRDALFIWRRSEFNGRMNFIDY